MRLRIGLVLLAVLLALGIGLRCLFHHIHGPLAETLQEASDYALTEDWTKAEALAQRAREQWDRYRNFTAAVADHAPLEDMDALFSQLDIYRRMGQHGEFAAICIQLSKMAQAMEESQAFTWWTLW